MPAVRRAGSLLMLAVCAFFLASAAWEVCVDESADCGSACHFFCQDGCAQAPVADPTQCWAPPDAITRVAAAQDGVPLAPFVALDTAPPRT